MADVEPTHEIISRKEAIARGSKRYFSNQKCSSGHLAERQVSSWQCVVCGSENHKKWVSENPEKSKIGKRESQHRNRYNYRRSQKKWRDDHPEYMRASKRNSKAKRKLATGCHTVQDIADIRKMQRGKCAYCRINMGVKYTVDHIVALSKGGANDRRNLQLVCHRCNSEKHARDPLYHARILGRLL